MMWLLVAAALLACAGAALIPEPEVHIQVLEKPFLCKRKTKSGDMLLVHSDGVLEANGTRFYSTYVENNGQPVWFTLGIREVIKGWDKGLQDMCVGEKRKITVPPALAYGKEGKVLGPKCGLVLHEYSPLENTFVLTELMHVEPPPFCQCLYYNRKNSSRQYINL